MDIHIKHYFYSKVFVTVAVKIQNYRVGWVSNEISSPGNMNDNDPTWQPDNEINIVNTTMDRSPIKFALRAPRPRIKYKIH